MGTKDDTVRNMWVWSVYSLLVPGVPGYAVTKGGVDCVPLNSVNHFLS